MEFSKHKLLIDVEEFEHLKEAASSFELLHASYEALKVEKNQLSQDIIDLKIAGQKLGGILQNIRHHTDYLPSFYYDQMDAVFNETDEILSESV